MRFFTIQHSSRRSIQAISGALLIAVAISGLLLPASAGATVILPVAVDDSYGVVHNQVLTVNATEGVLVNDTIPPVGTWVASVTAPPVSGTLVFNPDGSFMYSPDHNFVGQDEFTYVLIDTSIATPLAAGVTGAGVVPSAMVSISVTNAPPAAAPDNYTTPQDTELVVPAPGVLANDFDTDGDSLSIDLGYTQPSHGSVLLNNATGAFTYTPDPGFVGTDTFRYTLIDQFESPKTSVGLSGDVTIQGFKSSADVTIEVTGAPAPTAT
jgi:Bacterial Ig domain